MKFSLMFGGPNNARCAERSLRHHELWIFIIIIFYTIGFHESINWLGMSQYNRPESHELRGFSEVECHFISTNHGLKQRQAKFCLNRQHKFAMHGILRASKAAVYYCMKTFHDRRWNCSSTERLPNIGKDLQLGTQEQAVVHAFASSSVLYEISRRCAQNKIAHCSCGNSDQVQSQYNSQRRLMFAGCPDNVDIGIKYVKKFTGYHKLGKKSKKKVKSLNDQTLKVKKINGHNYEAGIKIQLENQRTHCKCHGVSGSCAQRVCYRQLRRLDDEVLLTALRKQYLAAKFVDISSNNKLFIANPFGIQEGSPPIYIADTDLAFIEHSPDFCEPDPSVGSLGTHGRKCKIDNVSETATEHCSNMCCGREYRMSLEQKKTKCGCRIDENFKILCDDCFLNVKNFYCL
uniref:Protein Wnt n=1 Tax=Dendrocoelum lacteum TaxID=27895 RepID=T1E1C8_9PLAT